MKLNLDLIEFEDYLLKKQLKENSIYQYIKTIQKFLIGNPDINNIEDYNRFIIVHCINKRKSLVYSALLAYIKFKITDSNTRNKLLENLIKPKIRKDIKRERKYLTEKKILEVIDNMEVLKHKVISIIMHLTGVRIGTIMKLKEENVFFEEDNNKPVIRLALTGKGDKRNVPYIYDEVAQKIITNYFKQYPTDTDYYFLELGKFGNRKGDPNDLRKLYNMNYQWYWQDLKQALTATGINNKEWAAHDYRRCFARRAYLKFDKDIQVLKNLLNHSNVSTTLRYLDQSGLSNMDYYKELQK